jgi:hypothetical protein
MITTFNAMPELAVFQVRKGLWARRGRRQVPQSGAWRRIIGATVLGGLLALLGGCSAVKLAYGQADVVLWWWVDGYLDFDRQQAPQVKQAMGDWLAWHRQTQLPVYAGLAGRASADIRQPVTAEQACAWVDETQVWAQSALNAALPPMARFALALPPAQRSHLADKFEKTAREFDEEQVQVSEDKRRRQRLKSWRSSYGDLYGRLNEAQDLLLTEAAGRLVADPALRLAEMRVRQQAILALLERLNAAPTTQDRAQAELAALFRPLLTLGATGAPAWRSLQARQRQGHCELFAQMHQASTAVQREHAAQWLRGWEADLKGMAKAP